MPVKLSVYPSRYKHLKDCVFLPLHKACFCVACTGYWKNNFTLNSIKSLRFLLRPVYLKLQTCWACLLSLLFLILTGPLAVSVSVCQYALHTGVLCLAGSAPAITSWGVWVCKWKLAAHPAVLLTPYLLQRFLLYMQTGKGNTTVWCTTYDSPFAGKRAECTWFDSRPEYDYRESWLELFIPFLFYLFLTLFLSFLISLFSLFPIFYFPSVFVSSSLYPSLHIWPILLSLFLPFLIFYSQLTKCRCSLPQFCKANVPHSYLQTHSLFPTITGVLSSFVSRFFFQFILLTLRIKMVTTTEA